MDSESPTTRPDAASPQARHSEEIRHSLTPSSTSSPSSTPHEEDEDDDDDDDADLDVLPGAGDEKSEDMDGHRPTLYEVNSSNAVRRRASNMSSAAVSSRSASSMTGPNSNINNNFNINSNSAVLRRTISRRETMLSRIRSRPIPQFTHPLSHIPTTQDQLVDFDGPDDPYHPLNWPTLKKVSTTLLYGLTTMTATWASSAYSAGTDQVALEFGVSTQVATLGTALFLFGFGVGPLLWAPLSEVYGRRAAVLTPMLIAICFSFGSATAKDLQTLMLTRFFGAFFSSAPVTNTGGVLGDLYSPAWRGIAMAGCTSFLL
jgi:DHA1 family multidrug resistance protein-like MFS transporter